MIHILFNTQPVENTFEYRDKPIYTYTNNQDSEYGDSGTFAAMQTISVYTMAGVWLCQKKIDFFLT